MNDSGGFVVLGAGGHAAVVADMLLESGFSVRGFVAPEEGVGPFGLPILGNDLWLADCRSEDIQLANGIGSIRDTESRSRVFIHFLTLGFRFPFLVHPKAVISRQIDIDAGAQIMAGAVVQPGARIGVNAIINTGAIIDHDVHIGDHAHIAPGVTLSGGVSIGNNAHVGTGAKIIQNIMVGGDALIAAGAVVVRDVPSGTKVAGVPAHRMGQ